MLVGRRWQPKIRLDIGDCTVEEVQIGEVLLEVGHRELLCSRWHRMFHCTVLLVKCPTEWLHGEEIKKVQPHQYQDGIEMLQ